MREPWTDQQIDGLYRLVGDGLPFSQIGQVIGQTRNACISRFSRSRQKTEKFWTKRHNDALAECLEREESVARIAHDFGCSREAIEARVADLAKLIFGPGERRL